MTKDEIINIHCHVFAHHVDTDIDNVRTAMDEYAKQQAIAFYQSFTGYRDIPRHIIEKDYDIFIEQQNKHE